MNDMLSLPGMKKNDDDNNDEFSCYTELSCTCICRLDYWIGDNSTFSSLTGFSVALGRTLLREEKQRIVGNG